MKTSEIWSFPLRDDSNGLLRVILALKDLELDRLQPMAFLRDDSLLVQVSKQNTLTEGSFEKENLFFNGVLVSKIRSAKSLGFKKIAEKRVSIEEVEFPGWFANGRDNPVFYRGEMRYEVKEYNFEFVYAHWRVLLPGTSGIERLAGMISGYHEYLKSIETGSIKKGSGIWGDDIRYNSKRDEILKAIGMSFAEPYCKVLAEKYGERRLGVYQRAITPATSGAFGE